MKKMFISILILCMFISTVAIANDSDPIVGCWYICIDASDPVAGMSDKGIDYGLFILYFSEGGLILQSEIDFASNGGQATEPSPIGKWEKNGNEYKTSIIAGGSDKAFFEDDLLYVCMNKVQYHGFRKMTPIDMYYNIYRK